MYNTRMFVLEFIELITSRTRRLLITLDLVTFFINVIGLIMFLIQCYFCSNNVDAISRYFVLGIKDHLEHGL